jgi:hypothetical protein
MGQWANAVEGAILAALGLLMLLRNKGAVENILGLAWLMMALYDFSLLRPHSEAWADYGSYVIFIGAMVWLGASSRLQRHR